METAARIGPNAIIQLGETFAARGDLSRAAEIYAKADCLPLLADPPREMVNEAIVARLFTTVARELDEQDACACLREAGLRTGDYILGNRIPGLAKWLLRRLPSSWALGLLLKAIQKHSWTFAGSGHFSYSTGRKPSLAISNNQIATRLGCVWHEAVFTQIFSRLLRAPVRVSETSCCGNGSDGCRFDINFQA